MYGVDIAGNVLRRHTIQSKSTYLERALALWPSNCQSVNRSHHIRRFGRAEWKARLARDEERAPRGQKGLPRRTALRRHRHWHERTEIRWISRGHRLLPVIKQMRRLCVGDQDSEIPSRTLPPRLGQFATDVPLSTQCSLQKGHQDSTNRGTAETPCVNHQAFRHVPGIRQPCLHLVSFDVLAAKRHRAAQTSTFLP